MSSTMSFPSRKRPEAPAATSQARSARFCPAFLAFCLALNPAGTALAQPVGAAAVAAGAPPYPQAAPLTPAITEGYEWDTAHAALLASAPTPPEVAATGAVEAWRSLVATEALSFTDYSSFLLAYPDFPDETKLRLAAEKALAAGRIGAGDPARLPASLVTFFDRYPPQTNPARAQYALALAAMGRYEAPGVALAAWRGGTMSDADEANIRARWGGRFTQSDNDARLDALLWDGNIAQAQRIAPYASPAAQPIAQARIALQQGRDPQAPTYAPTPAYSPASPYTGAPAATAIEPTPSDAPERPYLPGSPLPSAIITQPPAPLPPGALADPGYLFDRARFLLHHGRAWEGASLLASHPPLTRPAFDPRRWVSLALTLAREASPDLIIPIAENTGDGFAPGTRLSDLSFPIRDDYTSLMWLGGTQALWWRGQQQRAAALFRRYAAAARTPQTRAKGEYWAARAIASIDPAAARTDYESAAQYPDQFYGMLSLEVLRRRLPSLTDPAHRAPSAAERAAFEARPITQAVRHVARDAEWQVTIRFFRAIADAARTETDFALLADLAHSLGRRDLAVIVGQAAETAGFPGFRDLAFPLIPTPPGADWTAVHAVARQESQFAQNALSSAGARGLMQLMPATAADTARRLGLPYSYTGLLTDPALNIALGNAYFTHLLGVYGGSWPLAAAAYNAGPGNVSRWLRDLGDPRSGMIDWTDWIERIPLSETRGYVQHVVENAVVYEARHPAHAHYTGPSAIAYCSASAPLAQIWGCR